MSKRFTYFFSSPQLFHLGFVSEHGMHGNIDTENFQMFKGQWLSMGSIRFIVSILAKEKIKNRRKGDICLPVT